MKHIILLTVICISHDIIFGMNYQRNQTAQNQQFDQQYIALLEAQRAAAKMHQCPFKTVKASTKYRCYDYNKKFLKKNKK